MTQMMIGKMKTMIINNFTGSNFFLSNFYLCEVRLNGVLYPSVEHAYQAAKTTNPLVREKIRQAKTPGEAKKLGRQTALRAGWESSRLQVMENLLEQKFSNPELKNRLLDTRDATLVEGNYWGDEFWGVNSSTGVGLNHLGKLLMNLRLRLAEA